MNNDFFRKTGSFISRCYGFDKLFYALVAVQAVLIVIAWIAGKCGAQVVYYVCFVVQLLLFAYMIFRVLSRKKEKRARENEAFLSFAGRLKSGKGSVSDRSGRRSRGNNVYPDADGIHVFTECPACHAKIRLPKTSGKHGVKCPRCGDEFSVKI